MPSLDDFRSKLRGDDEQKRQAMTEYVVHVDATSLDGDTEERQECREQDVAFEFQEPNVILMRAAGEGDARSRRIWYLPWFTRGASRADLGDDGPRYFSTSQLDGCRFTVHYHDESRRNVTLLHLSGRLGTGSTISEPRNQLEEGELGGTAGKRMRRYSSAKLGRQARSEALDNLGMLFYTGNKSTIWGYRARNGGWNFFAQEMFQRFGRPDEGMGVKRLT